MNNYPYPVLKDNMSSYKDAAFELLCSECYVREGTVNIALYIKLTSTTINDLLIQGKAKAIVKATSDISTEVIDIDINSEKKNILLSCEKLRANDIISVTAYIVAKNPFDFFWNEELMDYYPKDLKTTIRKNDVLAISNTEKYDYTVVNTDFIKIRSSDAQEGRGISIKLTNDNFIEIIVSNAFNHAYAATKNDPKISPIFGSHLVFETFVLVLIEIIQDKEQYAEKEWFRLFSNLLQATVGESVDEVVQKIKDECLDMNEIFKLANLLTNDQIEQSLIRVSQEVEK